MNKSLIVGSVLGAIAVTAGGALAGIKYLGAGAGAEVISAKEKSPVVLRIRLDRIPTELKDVAIQFLGQAVDMANAAPVPPEAKGIVEDIGLRSTRVRAPDRTLVTVPNGQFSSMTIENISARDKMLFHFMLNLHRDTTPDQVRTLLTAIKMILTENPKLEAGAAPVHLANVGKESLDLEMSAYVLTRSGDEFTEIQQDLYLRILDAVEAAGTKVARPPPAAPPASTGQLSPNGQSSPQPATSNNRR